MSNPRRFSASLFALVLTVSSAAHAAVAIGPETAISPDVAGVSQHAPDVSELGTVIWREDVGTMSIIRLKSIGGNLIEGGNGILSSNAFPGSRPSISVGWLRNVYVWEELSPLGGAIHDMVIRGEGPDIPPPPPSALLRNLSAGFSANPSVACGPSNCLVFSNAGTFLQENSADTISVPFPAGSTGSAVWTDARFLATYAVQNQSPCFGGICNVAPNLRLAEVDSSGPHDLVADGSLGSSAPQSRPSIALNGSVAVLATIEGGDAWFVPVDLPDSVAHAPIALDEREEWATDSIDISFSGNRFLVVWSSTDASGTRHDISAAVLDPSGRSIETGPFLIASEGISPAVARLGYGQFAIVYEKETGTALAPHSRVMFRLVNVQPRFRSVRR
ncbi:MAG: hypothetical protein ABI718_08390 [Acidobacteriota bacterium]